MVDFGSGTTADDLYPLFDRYGKVVDVFIPRDRRYAFRSADMYVLVSVYIYVASICLRMSTSVCVCESVREEIRSHFVCVCVKFLVILNAT